MSGTPGTVIARRSNVFDPPSTGTGGRYPASGAPSRTSPFFQQTLATRGERKPEDQRRLTPYPNTDTDPSGTQPKVGPMEQAEFTRVKANLRIIRTVEYCVTDPRDILRC